MYLDTAIKTPVPIRVKRLISMLNMRHRYSQFLLSHHKIVTWVETCYNLYSFIITYFRSISVTGNSQSNDTRGLRNKIYDESIMKCIFYLHFNFIYTSKSLFLQSALFCSITDQIYSL